MPANNSTNNNTLHFIFFKKFMPGSGLVINNYLAELFLQNNLQKYNFFSNTSFIKRFF